MQFYHLNKVLLALHNPHRASGIHFLHFARAVEVSRIEAEAVNSLAETFADLIEGGNTETYYPTVRYD
jgi:hypothetical protein